MKKFFTALILSFCFSQAGAADGIFTVSSFYQSNGYWTERFIPFAVHRADGSNVDKVTSVSVARPCYSMIDPHRAYIFHIYCSIAADPAFTVFVEDGGKNYSVALPAIHIEKVALISSTPKPGGGGTPGDPLAPGRNLFKSCAGCHPTPNPLPPSVTADMIKNAANSVDGMSAFRSLTDQERANLAKYITEGL